MKSVGSTSALTACLEGDILIADRFSNKGALYAK